MPKQAEGAIAARIRKMAEQHNITYVRGSHDTLADEVTRLAGDDVQLDEIENLLIALHRQGHLSRVEMIQLQAAYLRETRS